MQRVGSRRWFWLWLLIAALILASDVSAQTSSEEVLSSADWQQIDQSVDRALLWLISQQQPDGSFPTAPQGQPAVTSLCVMAFVAHGHLPGEGTYGVHLQSAVDYVLQLQKKNGLISLAGPSGKIDPRRVNVRIGIPASYNHAMSSLMLSEIYGMGVHEAAQDLQTVIEKSLQLTLQMQRWPKRRQIDRGGWRYLTNYDQYNADLSVAGWHLMFLRSAKNSGFDVAQQPISEAVSFVKRCYLPEDKIFTYFPESGVKKHQTHAMQGAGVLALSHSGINDSPEARQASQWLIKNPFTKYGEIVDAPHSRYHYGLFLCTLAMHQVGGDAWQQYFPIAMQSLLSGQQPDGSWPVERAKNDHLYGSCYTTALSALTLATPNELLPIFQR